MEAIKKKIAALKMEMDGANEKVEANEVKAKQENMRADKIYDEVRDLEKKLVQMEKDYEVSKSSLETSTTELERCEKAYTKVSGPGRRTPGAAGARRGAAARYDGLTLR